MNDVEVLEKQIDEGFDSLRCAIVQVAIRDYKKALNKKCKWDSEVDTLEKFFKSEYGEMLSGVDGDVLIESVKEELYGQG